MCKICRYIYLEEFMVSVNLHMMCKNMSVHLIGRTYGIIMAKLPDCLQRKPLKHLLGGSSQPMPRGGNCKKKECKK